MRNWHYTIPRDINNKLSRMRNPWFNLVLEYDNQNNKRFVLHEIIYDYIVSPF